MKIVVMTTHLQYCCQSGKELNFIFKIVGKHLETIYKWTALVTGIWQKFAETELKARTDWRKLVHIQSKCIKRQDRWTDRNRTRKWLRDEENNKGSTVEQHITDKQWLKMSDI